MVKNYPGPVVLKTFFYSMTAQALHPFSYKTKSPNCNIFVLLGRGEKDDHLYESTGTYSNCWKGRTRQRTKKLEEHCNPEDLTSRYSCGHQINSQMNIVLGQRFLLWDTMPQPLAPGDIHHSCQDTQLAQERFQNLTGSKIASKLVFLI